MGLSGNRRVKRESSLNKSGGVTRREAFALAALGLVAAAPGAARAAGPDGQLTWGVHISLAPCLAESFSASEDGLVYELVLRSGTKFHNGDPITAEDVKFSFERYRGTSHDLMKDRVAAVEALDSRHVRFTLKKPWTTSSPFMRAPPEPDG